MDPANLQSEMANCWQTVSSTRKWLIVDELVEGEASVAFDVIMLLHGEDPATRILKGVFDVVDASASVFTGMTGTLTLEDDLMGRIVKVEKRVWGRSFESRWYYEVIAAVERLIRLDW